MASFEDLGLREELVRALEDEEIEAPTAVQAAVIPALRRGTNLIARTSSGSGKTLAYVLGILDRLEPPTATDGEADAASTTAPRMLVLTATSEEAERIGLTAFPYAQAVGFAVAVAGGGWGTAPGEAEVVIAPASDAMAAVQGSALKLDGIEAVVIDGAAAMQELGELEHVDALLDLIPRDAQRVLVSSAFPEAVSDLGDRRVKRALSYPSEAALEDARTPTAHGRIGYVLVTGRDKLEVLVRQLAEPKEGELPPVLFCRSDQRAADLAEQLSLRGFLIGAIDDPDADAAVVAADATRAGLVEESGEEIGQTISFDVPADVETLRRRHGGDGDAVILVAPRELPHLREIARTAGLTAAAIALPTARGVARARVEEFRDRIRSAVREEDLSAQMLVLEPLLDEFPAHEIAAAASALLRRRVPLPAPAPAPVTPPAESPPTRQERPAGSEPGAPRRGAAPAGPPPATWARLYVGVGSRDDVRPGDIVGAVAGEAEIPGSRIGKIDIRDNFSIVEVQADIADRVIRAVNGTSIKGRSVRVDYDRGDRSRRGGAPPRRRDREGR